MDFEKCLAALTRALRQRAPFEALFNPYTDNASELDLPDGPKRRLSNLRAYLRAHEGARYLLVGEAPGHKGCRFSGVPFTSEEQLLGDAPLPWTARYKLRRSSCEGELNKEASATMVWEALRERRDCVLWNTIPWHPHEPGDPRSNREPNRDEIDAGLVLLTTFQAIFPDATTVAIGRVAERGLKRLGLSHRYVRHPSRGGKVAFLAGVAQLD